MWKGGGCGEDSGDRGDHVDCVEKDWDDDWDDDDGDDDCDDDDCIVDDRDGDDEEDDDRNDPNDPNDPANSTSSTTYSPRGNRLCVCSTWHAGRNATSSRRLQRRQTEIRDFHAPRVYQDIFGFQVPMNDARVMQVRQTAQQLR